MRASLLWWPWFWLHVNFKSIWCNYPKKLERLRATIITLQWVALIGAYTFCNFFTIHWFSFRKVRNWKHKKKMKLLKLHNLPKNGPRPGTFFFIFVSFNNNFIRKFADFSRIRTWIVRVEVEHTDHLTTTTTPTYNLLNVLFKMTWLSCNHVRMNTQFVPNWFGAFCHCEECFHFGREPWSSGYGRRLMLLRSWVRIPVPYTGSTFLTLICCKIVLMFVWKRPKINEKEAGDGPL